jgi:hypothetical protein
MRFLAATSLLLAPVLLLAGTLLRAPFNFFFPDQLAAMAEYPAQMTAAYTLFLAGNVLLWPAVVWLALEIRKTRPALAAWAGALVLFGLFERTFHAGIDQFALGVARRRGASYATDLVAESYQNLHLFSFLSFTIMFGWFVLAFAAWRGGVFGVTRSVALAAMGLLPLGVLKGTELLSIVGTAGLCVALVPAGISLLRKPSRRSVLVAAVAVPAVGLLAFASSLG